MRIAVWHNLPSGGGARALHDQIIGLLGRGHSLEVWCPPDADDTFLSVRDLVPVHVVPINEAQSSRRTLLPGARVRSMYETLASLRRMEEHCSNCASSINAGGFDILLAHPCRHFRTSAIGRHVSVPSCLYLQEPNRSLYEAAPNLPWIAGPATAPGGPLARLKAKLGEHADLRSLRVMARAERDNAASFDRLLVNSYFSRESVLRSYGLDAEVCYLGVDTEMFRPLGAPKSPFVLGLGSIHPSKGIELALRALSTISENSRPSLRWVGNFSLRAYEDSVVRLARDLGVRASFEVLLSDAKLVQTLGEAAALLCTSELEPFGYAPLEANACGTAVVAVAEGGFRETVRDGVNGFLVARRDPQAFGAAVRRLTDDLGEARRMGELAREYVLSGWTLPPAIIRLEDCLRDCLERSAQE
ncbi:MAG: glycosyltransferase [Thermoanaerobaculia bacterium]|nr:glycosyltransferase [Thermoanaerobaculia bacterium]